MGKVGLFVEDYRPQKVSELILPERIKKPALDYVETGEFPSLLLHGPAGTGKTTLAKAICTELECPWLLINGSDETGIDVLRTKVKEFASVYSMGSVFEDDAKSEYRVVIIDEADYLNKSSTQPALRGVMEEFSNTTRFIFTCNYPIKMMEAIHSRCSSFSFEFSASERKEMIKEFAKRVVFILKENNIKVEDKKILVSLIGKYFPDMRRILNILDSYSKSGTIDSGVLSIDPSSSFIEEVIKNLKKKDFKNLRLCIGENKDMIGGQIYHQLYNSLYDSLQDNSKPPAILSINEAQYKDSFVVSKEINFLALCIEILMECEFK